MHLRRVGNRCVGGLSVYRHDGGNLASIKKPTPFGCRAKLSAYRLRTPNRNYMS